MERAGAARSPRSATQTGEATRPDQGTDPQRARTSRSRGAGRPCKKKGRPPRERPSQCNFGVWCLWGPVAYLAGGGAVEVPMLSVPIEDDPVPMSLPMAVPVPMSVEVVVVSVVVVVEVVAGVVSSVVSSFLQPTRLNRPTSKHVKDR